MSTSLEQLLSNAGLDQKDQQRCRSVCRPSQKDFLSLVQWFGDEKKLKNTFNISDLRENHRFIPYNKAVLGIYIVAGYQLYSDAGDLNVDYEGKNHLLGQPLAIVKFNEPEYSRAKDEYDKFWEWRENRNPKRLEMEKEYFYDCKHAMHLVRLMRMAKEILEEGEVRVRRPDAQELLAIRNGSKTYEEIVAYAEEMDAYLEETYKKSSLPESVDRVMARDLYLEMLSEFWKIKIPR